ncbi:hypothetical protein RQP46_009433 [Phenoliferia psychrophenolica]
MCRYGVTTEIPSIHLVFGTVIGFIISYRTSSALCWHHVPTHTKVVAEGEEPEDDDIVRALIEKRSMINLVCAFSVSLKHYLRGEAGIYYKDLYPLVCWLPRYRLPNSVYIARADLGPEYRAQRPPLTPSFSESMEIIAQPKTPLLSSSERSTDFEPIKGCDLPESNSEYHAREEDRPAATALAVPLEITLLLSGWLSETSRRGVTPTPTLSALHSSIYLLLLPGQEIESPFGYDDNDLALELFCSTLIRELQELTAHPPEEAYPQNFCFVDTNLPLAKAPFYEGLSAVQMMEDEPVSSADFYAGLKTGSVRYFGSELRSAASVRHACDMV